MTDIYKRLANHLDKLPAGFPATESGVELRILKQLFTPEEAEAAMALTLFPESAESIAEKLGRDESDIETLFYAMSRKGLILRSGKEKKKYMAANFINGIWEFNVNSLSEALSRDINEYIPQMWDRRWSRQKTQQKRVIPVSKSISAEMNIMPYEKAERIIERQKKILAAPCICRKEERTAGNGCDKPLETCLMLGGSAYFYEENGIGRPVEQNEALQILKKGIEAGLVLQPSNSQNPMVICMCCGCCCYVLKNLNRLEEPARVACTNYFVTISPGDCTGCGSCEEICQMGAISIEGETAAVNPARCIGCGLCVTRCEFEAAILKKKEESGTCPVPADMVEEYMEMARERGLM